MRGQAWTPPWLKESRQLEQVYEIWNLVDTHDERGLRKVTVAPQRRRQLLSPRPDRTSAKIQNRLRTATPS